MQTTTNIVNTLPHTVLIAQLKPEAKIGFISAKPQVVLKSLEKYFEIKNLQEFKIGYLGQTPTIQLASVKHP